jgi:hypothetical protein
MNINSDIIALGVAGATGFLLASLIWIQAAGMFMLKVRRRAEKETWAAANRYYTRKDAQP